LVMRFLVGKLFHKREEKFHERRPDIRPGFFPVSVKPKIARALVNLTGVNKGKVMGILFVDWWNFTLKQVLIGLRVIGSDFG